MATQQQLNYDIVETEYGQQLAVSFDYDSQTVARIKDLPWETTHRKWSDDHEAWLIDYTERALEIFETRMNVVLPPDVRPDDGYQGSIDIVVPDGYTWFFIQDPPAQIDDLLYQELSYEAPNAEYTDSYQNGTWDGIVRLYKRGNHGGPVGLLDRTRDLIEDMGYDVDVTIEGDRQGDDAAFTWHFDYDLRNYQLEATDALLNNDGSGVLSMPTGTGKTVTGLAGVQELGREAIIVVHTQELLYQWKEEIEEIFGVTPGLIGDGKWSEGPITVAIMQTLVSRGADNLERDYGTLVFDECHRTSAAETMHEIGMNIDVKNRVGLSATPWRRISGEELKIEGAIGGVVYEVTAEQMIEEGYLAKPEFDIIDPSNFGTVDTAYTGEDYHSAYRHCISMSPTRNRAVAQKAADLADDGYKVLINVDRVAHGRLLEYALNGDITTEDLSEVASGMDTEKRMEFVSAVDNLGMVSEANAVFMHGADGTDTRQDVLQQFEDGDIDVLISTLLKEGVNIPSISGIVLAQAGKSDIAQIQTIGRALRPKNGDHAKIADVKDRGTYFNDQFEQRLEAMDDYYGEFGPKK